MFKSTEVVTFPFAQTGLLYLFAKKDSSLHSEITYVWCHLDTKEV